RPAHGRRWRVDRVHLGAGARSVEAVRALRVPARAPLRFETLERRLVGRNRGHPPKLPAAPHSGVVHRGHTPTDDAKAREALRAAAVLMIALAARRDTRLADARRSVPPPRLRAAAAALGLVLGDEGRR